MHNRRLRTERPKKSEKQSEPQAGKGSLASSLMTVPNLIRAAVVGGALYLGAHLGQPDMNEQVRAVQNHVATSEDGAAIGYAMMDAALQTNARGVTQVIANRYNTSPGEAERFGNLGYVINAIEGGKKVQPGKEQLGNVVFSEAQLSQENGTLSITYSPAGQDAQKYSVKSVETGTGLELILERNRAGLKMVQPTLDAAQPLVQPGPSEQQYKDGPPAVEGTTGSNQYDKAASGEQTSVTKPADTGYASATGTAQQPVGTLFKATD